MRQHLLTSPAVSSFSGEDTLSIWQDRVMQQPGALAVFLLGLTTAGCGSDRLIAVEAVPVPDAGVVDAGSPGCAAPTLTPGFSVKQLYVDAGASSTSVDAGGSDGGTDGGAAFGGDLDAGTTDTTLRTYGLFVPEGDSKIPRPLVFAYDGHGTAAATRPGMALEGPANGSAIFVYPENPVGTNGTRSWVTTDSVFFDALVDLLTHQACINDVFIAGFGSGANMTVQLACERASIVRGVALFSPSGPVPPCEGKDVAVFITHGLTDTDAKSAQTRDYWLSQNSCRSTDHAMDPSPCVTYDGCDTGYPVSWCEFDGGRAVPTWGPPAAWEFFASLLPR